ncbi:MAG: radical SAM protein [Firmicutes bacterium]|jgi:MoaA/NifB/PqqE/SkfB family radical SAM enzyme|nr:radical SAM protein [Bacillota bacterium]
MALDSVKKIAAEFALDKAINYITKDPDKNLFVLLDFVEKVARAPGHKEVVKKLKVHFKNNPRIMEQTRRIASNPKMLYNLINSWVVNGVFLGRTKRENIGRELGVSVPQLLLIDPTSSCNLRCEGCWAGEYSKVDRLEPELFSRIIKEAKELGIYWIVLSGGEPFCYPYLLDVVAEHPDSVFMSYTNGTLIDERVADRLADLANFSPSFSLEGWREQTDARRGKGTFDKVMHAMDLLRERGVFFGVSVTSMSNNIKEIFNEEFIDFLVDKGATYMWSFHYIPIGRNPNVDLMLTPEQRLWMIDKVRELRNTRPILIADFWNDGEFTGGCIAGGRQYCHINAAGDVEPCAFVHFAVDNIKDKSLREVLQNPLFKAYQKRQPFNENHLAPCPIIDAPASLRELIKESGAKPTHRGAEEVLQGEVAEHLDQISKKWLELAGQYQEKNNKNEDTPVREGINAG